MLWYVGSIYVIVLLLILIAGLGIAGMRLLAASAESVQGMLAGKKFSAGGDAKNRMPWINYAAVAFTGIIISYFALGLSAVNSNDTAHNHGGNGNQGVVQTVNSPGYGMAAGQGSVTDSQMQYFNAQLNYLDRNLRVMEAQHYKGF